MFRILFLLCVFAVSCLAKQGIKPNDIVFNDTLEADSFYVEYRYVDNDGQNSVDREWFTIKNGKIKKGRIERGTIYEIRRDSIAFQ